jgi:hypothetical protein
MQVKTENLLIATTGAFGFGSQHETPMGVELRSSVMQLLAVAMVQSADAYNLILLAWEDFREAFIERARYATLIDTLWGLDRPPLVSDRSASSASNGNDTGDGNGSGSGGSGSGPRVRSFRRSLGATNGNDSTDEESKSAATSAHYATAEQWQLRVHILVFVNGMIYLPLDLEERDAIRQDFIYAGLLEAIEVSFTLI